MSNKAFAMTPGNINMYGMLDEVPIFVNSELFDAKQDNKYICKNLDDVVSVLKDHEEVHAIDVCNGIEFPNSIVDHSTWNGPLFPHDFLDFVMESRGYYNQFVKATNNPNVSNQMKEFARMGFEQNLSQLLARVVYPNRAPDQTRIAKAQIPLFNVKADVKVHINKLLVKVDYNFIKD